MGYRSGAATFNALIDDFKKVDGYLTAAGMVDDTENTNARNGIEAMRHIGKLVQDIAVIVNPQEAILNRQNTYVTYTAPVYECPTLMETYQTDDSSALSLTLQRIDSARLAIAHSSSGEGEV